MNNADSKGLIFTHGEPCADQKRGIGDCQAIKIGKQVLSEFEEFEKGKNEGN